MKTNIQNHRETIRKKNETKNAKKTNKIYKKFENKIGTGEIEGDKVTRTSTPSSAGWVPCGGTCSLGFKSST